MDSKNIFIACSVMLQKADWEKSDNENEWSFVGDGNEFQTDTVQENINSFFSESSLYLVTDRHKSNEIKKEHAANIVCSELANQGVTLCNKDFKRFMVFSNIGVAKQGEYYS